MKAKVKYNKGYFLVIVYVGELILGPVSDKYNQYRFTDNPEGKATAEKYADDLNQYFKELK